MNISELIRKLQELQEEHGDLVVECGSGGAYGATLYGPIERIDVDTRDTVIGLEKYVYVK